MTTYLTTRKNANLELDGNQLSGDTFAIKDYIKAHLDAKWNGVSKSWTIDLGKLDKILDGNSIGLRICDRPQTATTSKAVTAWAVNTKYGRELGEDF